MIHGEDDPVVKPIPDAKDVVSMTSELGKVTSKGAIAYAVTPLTVTEIGWYVDPIGTVTASDVEVAAVTVAFTAPKYTTLFAGVVLKFVPVMVTVVSMGP